MIKRICNECHKPYRDYSHYTMAGMELKSMYIVKKRKSVTIWEYITSCPFCDMPAIKRPKQKKRKK